MDDILNRDIAVRYRVRDINTLKRLAVYLISNIGKPVSGNNLKEYLISNLQLRFLNFSPIWKITYVIQFLSKFSYSLKTKVRNPKKVYAIDLGLFSENSIIFSDERERRLENAVYLYLREKHTEIYYFYEKKEFDFVVLVKGKLKELIQVCYVLNDGNMERETSGLLAAMDFFAVNEGKIVTFNQRETFIKNGKTIRVIPASEFLGS